MWRWSRRRRTRGKILGIWALKTRTVTGRLSPGILSGATRGFPLKKERVWVWYEIRILCMKMTQINTSAERSYKAAVFFERRNERTFTKSGFSKSQTFTKEEGYVSNIRHDHGWNDLCIQKKIHRCSSLWCRRVIWLLFHYMSARVNFRLLPEKWNAQRDRNVTAMSKGDRTENWASWCVSVTSSDPHLLEEGHAFVFWLLRP